MSTYIPDISHHHPVTNWDTVESECQFLVSKATQGTTFIDSTLKRFISECEKRSIPYWLYTFLNRGNETLQAQWMVKVCKPLVGKHFMGYCLDVEQENDPQAIADALKWLKANGGKDKVLLYTMYADYQKYKRVIQERGSNVAWWEARYGQNIGRYSQSYPCHDGVDLHQFTSNGRVPGLSGLIDLNRLTGAKPLTWFTVQAGSADSDQSDRKSYTGDIPTLPSRGYFQYGDGIASLTDAKHIRNIKAMQKMLNWAIGAGLVVDGKFGQKTLTAVMAAQKSAHVIIDGKFGEKTLEALKSVKK